MAKKHRGVERREETKKTNLEVYNELFSGEKKRTNKNKLKKINGGGNINAK